MWVVVALNPRIASPDSYSLPLRRLLGFVAAGLDASLIPVMAYLVGLFSLGAQSMMRAGLACLTATLALRD